MEEAATNSKGVWRRHRGKLWIVVGVVVGTAISLWLNPARRPVTGLDIFWKPAFDSSASVLLVMPHPIMYHPSSRALLLDEH